MKTFEDRMRVRIVCRKPQDVDCPNKFTACGVDCLDCEHHEAMILDRGNVVGRGLLAERPEPEPEPEPIEVKKSKKDEAK